VGLKRIFARVCPKKILMRLLYEFSVAVGTCIFLYYVAIYLKIWFLITQLKKYAGLYTVRSLLAQYSAYSISTVLQLNQARTCPSFQVSQLLINYHIPKHEVTKNSLFLYAYILMCFLWRDKLSLYLITKKYSFIGIVEKCRNFCAQIFNKLKHLGCAWTPCCCITGFGRRHDFVRAWHFPFHNV